jgi:nicotinamidase-related amidase
VPLTVIDPTPALIVVDLQNGIVSLPGTEAALANSAELAKAFRAQRLPVVLVTVTGAAPGRTEAGGRSAVADRPAGWADVADELDPQPDDIRIVKQRWGAFHQTELHEELQRRGVTQVVVTGVATSIGVESTARAAHEHGYHVVVATDAVADMNPTAHRHSIEHIFGRLGETATTPEILTRLAERPVTA